MATNNTSGTYDFNLEIGDVIQEATEMIGGEVTLGEEPRSARRSINLILNDWQNRGVCLWTTNTTIVSIAAIVESASEKLNPYFTLPLEGPIQILVFNNQTEFKQSNVGLFTPEDEGNNIGGNAKLVGSKLFVYGRGDRNEYISNELSLNQNDEVLGYLYVGTPEVDAPKIPELENSDFVTYWN